MFEYLGLYAYEVRSKNEKLKVGDSYQDLDATYKILEDDQFDDIYILKDGNPIAVSYMGNPFKECDEYLDLD